MTNKKMFTRAEFEKLRQEIVLNKKFYRGEEFETDRKKWAGAMVKDSDLHKDALNVLVQAGNSLEKG